MRGAVLIGGLHQRRRQVDGRRGPVPPVGARGCPRGAVQGAEHVEQFRRDARRWEIGRAQAAQARAAGLEPSVRFNPVLLKPGSDRQSHVVVRGQTAGVVGAADYAQWRTRLRDVVLDDLAALRDEFDVVVVEGAGSIAEINLRGSDIANLGLASAADLPRRRRQ